MEKETLLNKQQNRVNLFLSPIVLDKSLPKFKIMDDKKRDENNSNSVLNKNDHIKILGTPNSINGLETIDYEVLKDWLENHANESISDFNITLSDKMRHNLEKVSAKGITFSWQVNGQSEIPHKDSLFRTIQNYFRKSKEEKIEKRQIAKFDVVKFFNEVKLATEDEANKYRNRLNEYITCIGYAEKAGQTALKERLFENLIINKYESILFAKGYTRILTESQLIKFAQNCPKALSLDYIANYTRTIPLNAVKKIMEINEWEVFDNYVILHYDPDGNSVTMTNEEKKKEVDKAKDPILFGVIAGSNKLYYICDWIDNMIGDDLTWDTVVDTLGQEILENGFLKEKID